MYNRTTLMVCFCLLIGSRSVFGVRKINNEALTMIKQFEGFRANFYIDPVGIKTIGYGHACIGHACDNIHPPLTEAQGSELLQQDLVVFETCVERICPKLDDDKFSALVSFAFNLGCGSLQTSTLAKYVNQHNYRGAAAEFGKWVHGGGKVLPGLVKRRAAERALFCKSGGC